MSLTHYTVIVNEVGSEMRITLELVVDAITLAVCFLCLKGQIGVGVILGGRKSEAFKKITLLTKMEASKTKIVKKLLETISIFFLLVTYET